jgi:hypothetical protein
MVSSSTVIPPPVDVKLSSSSSTTTLLPRKDSNASSSGAYSEVSRSFGHDENSTDSLHNLTTTTSSSHYVIKCNLNTKTTTTSNTNTSSMSIPTSLAPVTLTPRVKLTVQQPSITTRPSHFDSSPESIPSSSSSSLFLKTPTSNNLPIFSPSIMTTSTASSAPEFSVSGTSSIDDSEESALYEQYLAISHGRQSNPSPEMRKKTFENWLDIQERTIPRSKSEVNTAPTEQSRQQQTVTSQIKSVSKSFFLRIDDILSDHCC